MALTDSIEHKLDRGLSDIRRTGRRVADAGVLMRRLVLLVVASASALGCGGSSSETPFPQSVSEVAAIPVLQRPQVRDKKRPAPAAAPVAAPAGSAPGDF